MAKFFDYDSEHPFQAQLEADVGPVILTNTFTVLPGQMDACIATWKKIALIAKKFPGYISTQFHQGVAGSNVLINVASWDSAHTLRDCLHSEEFKAVILEFPAGTECRAQVFQTLGIQNICVGVVKV
ncbi:antibiotic biosynthesis monooxygenase [Halenospora varia]|nr:antibiotic biosynthesis monooxygenase [Halenospora varia]